MANLLNRNTKAYLKSASPNDYPGPEWIHNPDMSPVDGVPVKYWKIAGDLVSEMGAGEKSVVDADIEAQRIDGVAQEGDNGILRAVVLALLDEINVLRADMTPPQPAITPLEMRNKIKAKVN